MQHPQKRFVGPDDLAFKLPDANPHNVRFDQAPNLPFAICEIVIKPRILERDGCLRREHLQHGDAVRSENAWREIVFEIEETAEFCLVN